MTVDCDTFLHAVTQELLLCTLFSYFYHFGLERDGANETRRERANYGNEILSGWGCSPSVSLSSWKSLPLPCCFSWPAVLTVPALCACVCKLVELHSYPLPFPWAWTHTLIMNRSVCMAAQWGSFGMLLHSNYALFKVSGKQIWIT